VEPLASLFRRFQLLFRRDAFTRDLDEEMAFHREQLEQELRNEGMADSASRDAAHRRLGNSTLHREQSYDTVAFPWESVIHDLRFAGRQLRKTPVYTATVILILALGIGATTAIFSVVNPILLQPLPYPASGRIMRISERHSDGTPWLVNFGTFYGIRERTRSFESLAVVKPWQPTMVGTSQPERLEGQSVSTDYFRVLDVTPKLGRDFEPADDLHHGPRVAILSDALWRRRFAADPSIIGQSVTLDGDLFTVIGVMPPGFENVLAPEAELWAPLQYDPSLPPNSREWGHHLRMMGRLRAGITPAQATGELDGILRILGQLYAKGYNESGGPPAGAQLDSLQSDVTRDVEPALIAIVGAAGLVLLIACVNVASLLLARSAQREGEFAMRAALGASRRRLTLQLLTESLLLALLSGVGGLAVAVVAVPVLKALSPAGLPRVAAIQIDVAVFAFALGIAALVGLAVGLAPALHTNRGELNLALHHSVRTSKGRQPLGRRALVVSEVALALVLLISAGLVLRSLRRLLHVDPGFDTTHLLTMQVRESGHYYDSDANRLQFFKDALAAVRAVPGVESAAFTVQLPLSGDYDVYGVQFESDPQGEEGGFRYAITPGYLETMHIPLRRGRVFDEHDSTGAPTAVLINESFAKRKFGARDPIGTRVRMGPDVGHNDRPWATIVGVVGDVRQESLAVAPEEAFYVPTTQWPWADEELSLVVRIRGDAAALAPSIRSAIWSVDKNQPIVRIVTMDALLAASEAKRRFTLILLETFALVGLILAATGIYGILSGSVAERTREIGIRAALGASRRGILGLVLRQGMALAALGVVIGLIGAVFASRTLMALLFEISPLDLVTYASVAGLVLFIAALACWIPASRAAGVDPAITLRAE
jgi:putative ABC transport system permease protein